ncbi:MAG: histidine triad nucleotide-binding protein [Acidobacteria bacterium RIFCSPLOWO2_02_FULL_61_28]|nr:MAG: histidine triad nucleotide-binding protein [Acidobacteria bacterium RIFCSPLOWO2_02_FULL_61_28]
MTSCIFCKIVAKEMPAKIVYEDDTSVAFLDINPQAPVHILVIPRKHFASAEETEEADAPVIGHLHRVAAKLAQEFKITDGYRIVLNTGRGAGQSVFHFHLHLLGGRIFHWPAG